MTVYKDVQDFVTLAIKNGAGEAADRIYLRNQLLHFLGRSTWEEPETETTAQMLDSLSLMDRLLTEAHENGVIPEEDEEFFASRLMDFITPLPSRVNKDFWENYQQSPQQATACFYQLAQTVNQVKTRENARNISYSYSSKYGELEITINLSKPEKDPKAIARAKLDTSSAYPSCALCFENEGYYGKENQVARSNHRLVRLELNGEHWGFQYSPYAYYTEHSIVLNEKHQPMVIDGRTFRNLLSFLDIFPHYMIGSNADLPIVGGSILTHDHYQAGRHEFPMARAAIRENITLTDFPDLSAGIVNWPMSVLRLSSKDKRQIIAASEKILEKWKIYSDENLDIVATTFDRTEGLPSAQPTAHHTLTPIARKRDAIYEMDLVLRDNNTSQAYPDGIFHPHADLHHIKKENIGLIEVMGLAILPPRLKAELAEVEAYLLNKPNQMAERHKIWADQLKTQQVFSKENVTKKVRQGVGEVFVRVLQDAGVFKDTAEGQTGFQKFIAFVNSERDIS